MTGVLWVALGGALGAGARHGVNLAFARSEFPWSTLLVNVVGCLAMGIIAALVPARLPLTPDMRLFLTTGVLGGFTTFSAFALDFAMLAEDRTVFAAGVYAAASVILSLAAVFAGMAMVRALAP